MTDRIPIDPAAFIDTLRRQLAYAQEQAIRWEALARTLLTKSSST